MKAVKKAKKKRNPFRVGGVKIKNAKKKTVDGINFKSSLEAFCYTQLKQNGFKDFQYEGHKFILQDKFDFPLLSWELQSKKTNGKIVKSFGPDSMKIRAITYTPDFVCINEAREGWIIETKGFETTDFKIKWKMFKKLLSDHEFKVDLYVPNTQENVMNTINLIKKRREL